MPIKIPNNLPASKVLTNEKVFFMTESRALRQDIRPLKILILNLMPTKIETETQFSRLLGNSPLQVEVDLMTTESYHAKNVPEEHLLNFYHTFRYYKDRKFDGMIITGAPVELMEFEEVDYWDELCEIMEWTRTHVTSTMHICWGAQAGLYYHNHIQKYALEKKMFGIFQHRIHDSGNLLLRGFDDVHFAPHSRHTGVHTSDIANDPRLDILSYSEEAGVCIAATKGRKRIYVTGHLEYDADTLAKEYRRDLLKGEAIQIPKNYFPDDDPDREPIVRWRSSANLLFSNWLNYFVYQSTPYNIDEISQTPDED